MTERRSAVRDAVVAGGVDTLRTLGRRLHDEGISAGPDDLRTDLRALGALKVVGPDGPVYALPAEGEGHVPRRTPKLATELVADPDWPLQLAVVAVLVLFLLVGLVGWIIAA